jgi:lipopolysaccharide biosynthesis regulator YciM
MSTLYNIIEEQRYTLLEIEELGGELTPELEQRLEIQAYQLQNKSIAYLEVIKQKEMFNDTIESEIKRLQAIKKQNDNLVSRLKDNLLNAVKMFGEYESGLNKFSARKSQLIMVEDVNALPKEYKVIKVTEAADKIALKKAIKSGKEIDGVTLINNYNLKIN